jgi:hypothetical protein
VDGATLALLGFAAVLALIFARMPIGLAMLLCGGVGVYLSTDSWTPVLAQLKSLTYDTFSSYSLSIVPLFLLMGQFATRGPVQVTKMSTVAWPRRSVHHGRKAKMAKAQPASTSSKSPGIGPSPSQISARPVTDASVIAASATSTSPPASASHRAAASSSAPRRRCSAGARPGKLTATPESLQPEYDPDRWTRLTRREMAGSSPAMTVCSCNSISSSCPDLIRASCGAASSHQRHI